MTNMEVQNRDVSATRRAIDKTKKVVADYFELDVNSITSVRKDRPLTYARYWIAWLLRFEIGLTHEAIAVEIGRDISNVSHSLATLQKKMREDAEVRMDLNILKSRIL